jgi:hypothetical protein
MTLFIYGCFDEVGAFIQRLCDNKHIRLVLQYELPVIVKGGAIIFFRGLRSVCNIVVCYRDDFIQLCRTGDIQQAGGPGVDAETGGFKFADAHFAVPSANVHPFSFFI